MDLVFNICLNSKNEALLFLTRNMNLHSVLRKNSNIWLKIPFLYLRDKRKEEYYSLSLHNFNTNYQIFFKSKYICI
jgi:hypothetical protein